MAAPRAIDGSRPVALVTGAARRVGRASAQALARAGCDVVITFRVSAGEAEESARELAGLGAAARVERLDLNDMEGAAHWAARLAAELPRLDVLVHNASVYRPSPLAEMTAETLLENFRVHAAGPALLTKHLALMLSRSPLKGGGAVVCMCDIHAMGRPRRDYLAYSISKAALEEMVRTLAVELAPAVRVNGVAPGAVAFAESGPDADPEMQRRYLSRVPLERSGTVEEAAEVVRWLALDATYITGEIVRVDGGRFLK
jgi:pteridine reductase